jgi:urease accessory protein
MPVLFDRKLSPDEAKTISGARVLALTSHERQRSRLAAMLPNGQAVAIVLSRGVFLEPGDVLGSESGETLEIQAADEPLMRVQAASAFELMRIVYHLANRHVRAMLSKDAIWIEPDPVLAKLIARLGGEVESVSGPFLPEGGAYVTGQHHHHGECDADDAQMGTVGESLSIAAHAREVS